MLVQNCKDLYNIFFEHKVNRIWDSTYKNAPCIAILESICLGSVTRPFHRRIELQNELNPQTGSLRFIPPCCVFSVISCTRLDVYPVQESRSLVRSSSRTSVHGRPVCGLARYASNRSSRIRL